MSVIRPTRCAGTGNKEGLHTDLVEAALIGEDGDMPVVSCASYMEGELLAYMTSTNTSLEQRTRHDGGGLLSVSGFVKFSCSSRRFA